MTIPIQLQNITKNYGSTRALDGVSLEVRDGITGLLGPNGAGKTTLLKVLLGHLSFSEGSGQIFDLSIQSRQKEIRDRVGYMPETECHIPQLTGIEMIQYAAELSGLPSDEALRRGHEILDYSALHEERHRKVREYSKGMKQKLKFAQAIVHDPDLLILDEPTSGLDPEERIDLLERVRDIHEKTEMVVLLSTHILPDVERICDDVIVLSEGRLQLKGNLEELTDPVSRSVTVTVMGEERTFLSAVEEEGFGVDAEPESGYRIQVDPEEARELWRIAERTDVVLTSVKPARNSLESVFLEALQSERNQEEPTRAHT